ncbi:hypothetical protein ECG_04539 [Echinococcus granulosus]|uniref:Dynein light chain n=1 Tax=Echinococcus granulosus TaxID=6210 RepID=U6J3Y6_ECHGR|nr:dynein light chain [Echinococcus granulosus]EUB64453.1 dynein light chain [Echinococcus granulosus]KAH9282494.1 hypothetical protein ECG_04540 [Echinococcus granulosus]KAH9283260.1 hypothetical protein ECG_04539 [Echinococcus granulosus]CDS17172.1 dynein light chain [Echinococcus granulosus]
MSSRYELKNFDTDMKEERQGRLKEIIYDLLNEAENRSWPQNLARRIKESCDEEFKGTWNCHVGPSFGSSFPYESKTYFYCEWDDLSILVYKFQ